MMSFPPTPPLVLAALFDNSEQGLHDLIVYLVRDHSVVNNNIRYPYYFRVPGGEDYFLTQPPIFWALDEFHYDYKWVCARVSILLNHGAELNVLLHCNGHTTPLHFVLTKMPSEDNPSSHLIKIHSAVVDHFELLVGEIFCCRGPLHDVNVAFTFRWDDVLLIQLDFEGGFVDAVSE